MAQLNKLQQMKRLKQNLSTAWTNVKVFYSVWPNVCLNKCSESLYNFTSRPSVGLNVFVFFIKIPQETHLHKEEEKTKNLAKLHSDIFFCFLILWIFSHASVAPKGVTFKQKHNSISLPSNWYTSHHTLLKFSFLSRCHKQISALLLYSEIRHSDWLKLIHVNYNIQSNAFFQH